MQQRLLAVERKLWGRRLVGAPAAAPVQKRNAIHTHQTMGTCLQTRTVLTGAQRAERGGGGGPRPRQLADSSRSLVARDNHMSALVTAREVTDCEARATRPPASMVHGKRRAARFALALLPARGGGGGGGGDPALEVYTVIIDHDVQ